MILNGIIKVIAEFGYQPLNSNLRSMALFYKANQSEMNIVAVLVNDNEIYNSEELENIRFQIERKFLLQGKKKVNFQYIIVSEDVDKDKKLCIDGTVNVWLVDSLAQRIMLYEDFDEQFKEIYTKIDDELSKGGFEKKINWKQLPYVTIGLFFINIIMFILVEINGSSMNTENMLSFGAADWKLIFREHEYYRLVTCMFLHFGISHLTNNMFSLLLVGKDVEKIYGKVQMFIIYFISGIGASVVSALYYMSTGTNAVSAGASGAIFGIIGAVVVSELFVAQDGGRNVRRIFILILIMALCGSGHIDNAAHAGGFITGVVVSFIIKFFVVRKNRLEEYRER